MKPKRRFLIFSGILFICVGVCIGSIFLYRHNLSIKNPEKEVVSESDTALLQILEESKKESLQVSGNSIEGDSPEYMTDKPETNETYATSHKTEAQPEMIPETTESVHISDTYAKKNTTVSFVRYEPDAYMYRWEIYNIKEKEWEPIEAVERYHDELNRNASKILVDATENTMVRCFTYFSEDTQAPQEEKAYLHLLEKEIKDISVADFITDKDKYISANQIPIHITYLDGTQEELKGLNGLFFLQMQETTNYSETESGNLVETKTITSTENCYLKTEETQTITIRYRPDNIGNIIDTDVVIEGKDITAPVIEDVSINPYEISDIDQPVTIQVKIEANDNDTPYPYLEYAFLLSGNLPKEADWSQKADFEMEIRKNGIYIAYVRDQAGNITTCEKEIVTVDVKPPQIKNISLEKENWCQENKIVMEATDTSTLTYCFQNKAMGISSDWITQNAFRITQNGLWSVQVKDAAGNISESEIEVQNIDTEAPTIHGIKIKDGD